MIVVDTTHNPIPGGDEMLPIAADLITIARKIGWKFWMDFAWITPEVSGSKNHLRFPRQSLCPRIWPGPQVDLIVFQRSKETLR
jgi:hypothetical protein